MAVQGVNTSTLGASYPKYLEDKRKRGAYLVMTGGLTGLSASVLHFSKHPFAVKNPKLALGLAIFGTIFSLIGINGAAKAQKQLNEFNSQSQGVNFRA